MIRNADIYDLDAINTIFNQAVKAKHQTAALTPITKEQRLKWYNEHDQNRYPIFVIETEEQVVGWYSLSPYRKGREALDQVVEVTYYLHKDHQRMGYGTKILEHAIKTAPDYGFSVLIAILFRHNKASIKLLEKFKFKLWGNFPETAQIDGKLYDHCFYGLHIK